VNRSRIVLGTRKHKLCIDRPRCCSVRLDRNLPKPLQVFRAFSANQYCRRSVAAQPDDMERNSLCVALFAGRVQSILVELPDNVTCRFAIPLTPGVPALHSVVCQGLNMRPPSACLLVRLSRQQGCAEEQSSEYDFPGCNHLGLLTCTILPEPVLKNVILCARFS